MKRQIVAILIALVAITCLLTVSVHSEEAYKPIIQSVTLSSTEIVNGGEVTLTVIAKSNAPVNFLSYRLDGPNGGIHGGGGSAAFTNIGDDLWKHEHWPYTVSEWAPSGTYTYSHISVENEGQLTSDEWGPVSFNVTNDHEAYKPIIQSVTVSPTEVVNSGEVTLTVIAKSNAPVNYLSYRLDGPNGGIHGGGGSAAFTNIGDDLWKHEHWPYTVSEWDPSGIYTYSHISVENEGQLTSDEWGPVSFNVTNDHEAYKPIIQLVTVSPTEVVNSGEVTLTVIAKSNAPINYLSYRLDGPNGGIHGGGGSAAFTTIGDDLWKHEHWPYTVSEWDPIGTYTYSRISVENEGQLTSDEWGPISFNVTRTAPPEITSYAPESPVDDYVGATRTFEITINQTVNVSWQINGTEVQTDTSVTAASYTNTSAANGSWNVSAIVTNANGTDMQTWTWTVTSPCFIATAAYGTPLHEDINVLRDFRDEYLMPYPAGRTFVKIYYSSSPPLADLIRGNAWLRTAVREGLVKPLVAITRRVVE
jgi:hypothetical protein